MPLRQLDAEVTYYLVLFDRDGRERPETDGSLLSKTLTDAVRNGATDVFLCSHGWMGDVPAAISQYNAWMGVMAAQADARDRARALDPGFKPVIVGAHWPSRPWGEEDTGAGLLGPEEDDEFAAERQMSSAELIERYASRIADTDATRAALTAIMAATQDGRAAAGLEDGTLPPGLDAAYQTLFTEAGLGLGGPAAAPGSDQQVFQPTRTISEWTSATTGAVQPGFGLLGGGLRHGVKDALLMPVRQLSFWTMKDRARRIGESGVHDLLITLQQAAPRARFHLMGHSFGCIVVSAAIAGRLGQGAIVSRLPRPVHSLFLVQGALSLWSFAEAIPYPPRVPGYFRPIGAAPALVSGPVVTTRSTFDRAVGTFFPLAARLGHDLLLGDELPEFGAVGAFGLQGLPRGQAADLPVLNADAQYRFDAGRTYNIDASRVICHGRGPSGAHCDIAHPEIAHIFWQAALAGIAWL
jgi:hypothetical protein